MMKNGILVCIGKGRLKNIGDYIQSIAARQFAGPDAVSVEREALDTYAGGPTRVAMNAWFMHRPKRFPPSDDIVSLFTSFHVRPEIESRFFTDRTVAYLKRHEPIGCRSTEVVEMMARHGVRAYFSSCVTLTLGLTYRHEDTSEPPVFVDPRFWRLPLAKEGLGARIAAFVRLLTVLPHGLAHIRIATKLAAKFRDFAYWPCNWLPPIRWLYAAEFHRAYSTMFSDALLLRAEYVTHKVPKRDYPTEEALMSRADALLKRYARAPFVVTGRLHCSLPCLAMGTPCWVVMPGPKVDAGRFGGNDAFMNQLRLGEDGRLVPPNGFTDKDAVPPVRTDHVAAAETLTRQLRDFFRGDKPEGVSDHG